MNSTQAKGFVDLQVNGFLGIDFSFPGITLDEIVQVVSELRNRGTIAFCPTVITSSLDTYRTNLPVLAQAHSSPDISGHLLGIHLEGPFISAKDGARGAHPSDSVHLPDIDLFDQLLDLAEGQVSLLTLAPEIPGAIDLIEHAVSKGISVSLGHHLAKPQQIEDAVNAGARASTHLGNGLPNCIDRHNNPLWPQIANQSLNAMLITDSHHIPDDFIMSVVLAKTSERVIVVSDSAPVAGFKPGIYQTLGQEVHLEESGRLWNPVGNHLVGSSASMFDCMNHLASLSLLREEELWRVGHDNPLQFIGAQLEPSSQGPAVEFKDNRFILIE